MQTLEALNHGDGTITVFVRCQEHIDWLRSRGVSCERLGNLIVAGADRVRIYPTLSEAMSPAIARYLDTLQNERESQ